MREKYVLKDEIVLNIPIAQVHTKSFRAKK